MFGIFLFFWLFWQLSLNQLHHLFFVLYHCWWVLSSAAIHQLICRGWKVFRDLEHYMVGKHVTARLIINSWNEVAPLEQRFETWHLRLCLQHFVPCNHEIVVSILHHRLLVYLQTYLSWSLQYLDYLWGLIHMCRYTLLNQSFSLHVVNEQQIVCILSGVLKHKVFQWSYAPICQLVLLICGHITVVWQQKC